MGILIEKHLRLHCLKKICSFGCNCKDHLLNSKFDQWSICFYYQALDCSFGFKCLESSKGKLFQRKIKIPPLATWLRFITMFNNIKCSKYLTGQHGNVEGVVAGVSSYICLIKSCAISLLFLERPIATKFSWVLRWMQEQVVSWSWNDAKPNRF